MWCAQMFSDFLASNTVYRIVKKERKMERMKDIQTAPCVCVRQGNVHVPCDILITFTTLTIYLFGPFSFCTFFDQKEEILMTNLSFIHCQWKLFFPGSNNMNYDFSFIFSGSVYCFVWPIEMQLSHTQAQTHRHWLATAEIKSNKITANKTIEMKIN